MKLEFFVSKCLDGTTNTNEAGILTFLYPNVWSGFCCVFATECLAGEQRGKKISKIVFHSVWGPMLQKNVSNPILLHIFKHEQRAKIHMVH
jgi:hypothetical protein